MRLEMLPLVIGALIGLVGLMLVWDAWAPIDVVSRERRRRPRRERDRGGEALVGLGAIALAGAWLGRDTWRWDTVAVIVGTLLLLIGAMRSRAYLRELFTRPVRSPEPEPAAEPPELVTPSQLVDVPRRIR